MCSSESSIDGFRSSKTAKFSVRVVAMAKASYWGRTFPAGMVHLGTDQSAIYENDAATLDACVYIYVYVYALLSVYILLMLHLYMLY